MSEQVRENLCREDRDLLIELKTQVKGIRDDIKDLKDGTTERINTLEKCKADRDELDSLQKKVNIDHEERTRKLENKTGNYAITLGLYSVAVATMIGLIIYHILQTQ